MISCTNCGTLNQSGSLYCDECGASLKKTDSFRIHNGGFEAPVTETEPVQSQMAPEPPIELQIPPAPPVVATSPYAPKTPSEPQMVQPIPAYVPPAQFPQQPEQAQQQFQPEIQTQQPLVHPEPEPVNDIPVNVTSFGVPPMEESAPAAVETVLAVSVAPAEAEADEEAAKNVHATLTIERGSAVGKEFSLTSNEAFIGRWDADNGIFPDVDLDSHDPEAKVSRRHARVVLKDGVYSVEDLGSTNGTFINRGRRLLPGNPNILTDNDELIVGKTFMRFRVKN